MISCLIVRCRYGQFIAIVPSLVCGSLCKLVEIKVKDTMFEGRTFSRSRVSQVLAALSQMTVITVIRVIAAVVDVDRTGISGARVRYYVGSCYSFEGLAGTTFIST